MREEMREEMTAFQATIFAGCIAAAGALWHQEEGMPDAARVIETAHKIYKALKTENLKTQ